jgi:hypothetical protein
MRPYCCEQSVSCARSMFDFSAGGGAGSLALALVCTPITPMVRSRIVAGADRDLIIAVALKLICECDDNNHF